MTSCIFCSILNNDIPSYKVYENEYVYAFLDITQVTKGHTLIIPKQHVCDVFEWNEDIANHIGQAIPVVAKALQKAFPDMQGLNIVNNNKELAYQSVFHSHIHLIPRYTKDDRFSMTFGTQQLSPETMETIAQTIQRAF